MGIVLRKKEKGWEDGVLGGVVGVFEFLKGDRVYSILVCIRVVIVVVNVRVIRY